MRRAIRRSGYIPVRLVNWRMSQLVQNRRLMILRCPYYAVLLVRLYSARCTIVALTHDPSCGSKALEFIDMYIQARHPEYKVPDGADALQTSLERDQNEAD